MKLTKKETIVFLVALILILSAFTYTIIFSNDALEEPARRPQGLPTSVKQDS